MRFIFRPGSTLAIGNLGPISLGLLILYRNSTLPCDQDLFQMTSTVDNYFWTSDNLTALCTRDCFAAANGWNSDVQNRCAGDTLVAYNKVVPADSVAGRYLDGIQIACLTNGK